MDYKMPLYLQLRETIKQRIEDGEYLPGEFIPSERTMAKTYGINRMTVKMAIQSLVEENILIIKPSVGTLVRKKDTLLALGVDKSGISAKLKNVGETSNSKVIFSDSVDNIGNAREVLELNENDPIYALHRVRYSGTQSIAVEYSYLPKKLFENVDSINFSKVSLYDYMDSKNHKPVRIKRMFEIIKAPNKEAAYLGVSLGIPIYRFQYIGYDMNNQIVEFTSTYIRCENVKFHLTSSR